MSEAAIVLDDVHVTYRIAGGTSVGRRFARREAVRRTKDVRAVRGVTLTAARGEVVGLIGRNGSGKSSLLRAVAGLLPVTSGQIHAVATPLLLGVGAALKPDSTGRQNILLGGAALGLDRAELLEQQVDEILEFAGLTDVADRPFRTYSSGMKARLQFSIATATRPRILLIDEALAVGDQEFKDRSRDRIQEMVAGDATVLLVSHSLGEIVDRCDRVLWLDDGEQRAWGPAEDVVDAYRDDVQRRRNAAGSADGLAAIEDDPTTGIDPDAHDTLRSVVEQRQDEVRRLTTRASRPTDGKDGEFEDLPGPIFVGGTGRSGTWIVGRMLARHPDIITIRTELRFHSTDGGYRDVLDRRETVETFAERLATRWATLQGPTGAPKGLRMLATNREISRAERHLLETAGNDLPWALCTHMRMLVDPYVLGRGAFNWVETTPDNAEAADCLHLVFPESRVVHMVRDGRDVAASVVSMPWGPETLLEALDWWAERVHAAEAAARAADPARLRVVRMERLVHLARDEEFDGLMSFLSIRDRRRCRSYFEGNVDPAKGHVGRWRSDTPADETARIDRRYRELYDAMAAEGVSCLPITPDEADAISH